MLVVVVVLLLVVVLVLQETLDRLTGNKDLQTVLSYICGDYGVFGVVVVGGGGGVVVVCWWWWWCWCCRRPWTASRATRT